jgi:uncharacterized repeat protein (TIGR03803 family)
LNAISCIFLHFQHKIFQYFLFEFFILKQNQMKNTFTSFIVLLVIGLAGITCANGQTRLYGMTQFGGANGLGTIFHYTPSTGIHTLDISLPVISGGANQPCGSLTAKGDKFYGMTYAGGANNLGAIFEYDPATNILAGKFDFVNATGATPLNSLTLYNGKFYGMTFSGGGTNGFDGVIFEWDPVTNTYIDKFDFAYLTSGANPFGNLTLYKGKFYGMTTSGGDHYNGTLFEWDPATSTFSKIWDFVSPTGNRGYGTLSVAGDKLYGVTDYGGSNLRGVIFELDPATNVYTKKIDFDDLTGWGHQNSLTLSNGKFYGSSQAGGEIGGGVLFDWDPLSNIITPDINLDDASGYLPWGSLTASNGKFYGLTMLGGANEVGVIFEWDPVTNTYLDKFDFDGTNGSNPYLTTLLEYTPPVPPVPISNWALIAGIALIAITGIIRFRRLI